MKLGEAYGKLMVVLASFDDRCQVTRDNIIKIENHVVSHGQFAINLKLQILRGWILMTKTELYGNHQNQGYVCAFLSEHHGISVEWVKDKSLVEDKAFYESNGQKVVSIEEIIDIIVQFEKEVDIGTWAKAVAWLNLYGKSSGWDFRKLSPMVQEIK